MADTEVFRRRHLPHWDMPGATYFVTACLDGSIPAQGLLDIQAYKTSLARQPRPTEISKDEWLRRQWKLEFVRVEQWLDQALAIRHLANPELADAVVNSLLFFAGRRYELLSFVIMPSHFHWVFRPLEAWIKELPVEAVPRTPREISMHSVKRFTGNECNKMLGLTGTFWQAESHDHWVRDVDELDRIINYIEYNPVKAGLCAEPHDWLHGSASIRQSKGIALGSPLS